MIALVWVEHEGGQLKDATLAAVTAAGKLGEVHAVVAGANVGGVAEQATGGAPSRKSGCTIRPMCQSCATI